MNVKRWRIQNKEKVELQVSKNIRASLSEIIHQFKLKEFPLRTYSYDYVNNKIDFFEERLSQ